MVMKKNVMGKNLSQTILNSITRYIAIVLIIALGAAMFVGLRTTKKDMIQTGQEYMDEANMFDLRLLSSYGWSKEDVDRIAALEGVVDAEGVMSLDVLAGFEGQGDESVYKIYDLPDSVTKPLLQGGRMPEKADECLVDGARFDDSILGSKLVLSVKNSDDTMESLTYHTFTVVGYVSSPLYMDMSRGTTTLGNGTVTAYVYIPKDAFQMDYYTEIGITIDCDHTIYSEAFHDAMDDMAEQIKPLLEPIAYERYEQVRLDALEAYNDGLETYEEGYQEYLDAKNDALQELEDARQELLDGQAEIDENRLLLEDALQQIEEGQAEIDENLLLLIESRQELAAGKAQAYSQLASATSLLMENRKTVLSNKTLVDEGIAQIDNGLLQIDDGIAQLESGLEQLELMESLMSTLLSVLDVGIESAQLALDQAKDSGIVDEQTLAELEARLQELLDQKAEYDAQLQEMTESRETYTKQLEELYVQRESVVAQRAELVESQALLQDALNTIEESFLELQSNQTMAENEFAAAEAQIEAGQLQLDTAQKELNAAREEAQAGLTALEEAQRLLDEGWVEFLEGEEEAMRKLSEAELELLEGKHELDQAWEQIESLQEPSVYALGRQTNVSYISLESNSDIVEGVSAVFPVFFLLIAALVCITTMTRMVEEERTQIGTLKALGYSNFAIIGKYLAYAGSAALLGCGFGTLLGSGLFPLIIWEAYNIILNIRSNLTLVIDWNLCLTVFVAYTAVVLAVTWYCCRSLLREVPAELIRPKPPTSGRKILLEYLPFWNKISFLNKVMLRNIFRYRQRLLMMLVGIGGCCALLLTGYGIRDSIMEVVDVQFDTVTLYDIEVRFEDGMKQEDQAKFREEIGRYVDQITFAHQSSVEIEFDGQSRDILLIAANSDFERYMDFHSGSDKLSMPDSGEALLSVGMAEKLGIRVGDKVTIRDPDLNILELTVSGIYDNYVYNYIIVSPETVQAQWGEEPALQMAYVTVKSSQDAHHAGTKISAYDGVMSVTICEDLADQVRSMLDALNLVVITVVVCAGLLAITVTYNLTNINITERIREIATIKVLGFNAMESAAYVFKENLLLTGMGAGVGIFFGQWLLEFVMSQIKVDMVWMEARLLTPSYLWSIGLTILSAIIVDFVLYFKLEKINMAEALKSVE